MKRRRKLGRFAAPLRIAAAAAAACCLGFAAADLRIGADDSAAGQFAPVTESDRAFWSFRPVTRPAVPRVAGANRVRTEIDAFILARLEAKGLTLAPDADRRTLIRRLSLDLLGLPPTPEEIDAFLGDDAPDAIERLVDRLLASPAFGERWGRHWLDVAGYVDTVGFDVDPDNIITSESKWLYRDYVIRAFNDDKPYDRFLAEQFAGDELVDWRNAPTFTPEIKDLLIATGYLRTAPDFTHEDVGNIPQNHFNILHDTIEIIGTSVLGLTLNCARCHTHKFDPIPHEDYYRLMAVLTPAYNPHDWKVVFPYDKTVVDRVLPDVSPAEKTEIDRHNAEIERQVGAITAKLEEFRNPHREKLFEAKLATVPEAIRADTRTAVETPAEKRNEIQKYLASKFEGQLKVTSEEISKAMTDDERAAAGKLDGEIAALNQRRRSHGKIQALFDVGAPPVTRRLTGGNFETPAEEVQPGTLRVLCEPGTGPLLSPAAVPAGTSGRRLALAQWLTAPGSRAAGLTARVMVNRIWQHLFGTGIVPTPENFGVGGEAPTHSELLEWLSAEFMRGGWRIKPLIRQIVLSSVYRQSSQAETAAAAAGMAADPENRLLWRMRLKRLESEVIRDSVLAASGALDRTMGGRPVMLEARPDGMIVVAEKNQPGPTARLRRSAYLLARRAFQLSEMTVFDQPVVATSCPERTRSAVPLQSLAMLNGQFLWEQAEQLAGRMLSAAPEARDARIAATFARAIGRPPSDSETAAGAELIDRQTASYRAATPDMSPTEAERKAFVHFCHTLLNTSEFLYVP